MKNVFFLAFFLIASLTAPPTWSFGFAHPSEGDVVVAGSTLKVLIDIGKMDPLFGVLLASSGGIVQAKLDSLPPFKWEIDIPTGYYGPLTLWAIGRRFYPIPNPPRASVTIFVVYPVVPIAFLSPFSAPASQLSAASFNMD